MSAQRVTDSILYNSHRSNQEDIHTSRARVPAETGRQVAHETEQNVRYGVRPVDQTSDDGTIESERFAIVWFQRRKGAQTLSPPGLEGLDRHPQIWTTPEGSSGKVPREPASESSCTPYGHRAETLKNSTEIKH